MNAILGGSFNPPHAGHLAMARSVLDLGLADSVALMPCYSHNFGKKMLTPRHRLAMCRLCEEEGITVDNFEVKNKLDGKTLSLVMALEIEGRDRPTLIIGGDNAACFGEWHRHEEVLMHARFIVVPREGSELSHEVRRMFSPPHVILEKGVVTVSSTQVRRCLADWWSCGCPADVPVGLPPGVLSYIREHSLYRS